MPSVAIVDSQSIRTAEGGEERGYDAGKKITGHKRHLAVDTLGLVWAVVFHAAYWQDHDGVCFVLQKLSDFGRLRVLFADSAYNRQAAAPTATLSASKDTRRKVVRLVSLADRAPSIPMQECRPVM